MTPDSDSPGTAHHPPPHGSLLLPFKVGARPSKIDGSGLFADQDIPEHRKFGELAGTLISIRKGRAMVAGNKRLALVELDHRYALDASRSTHPIRYINHSCSPNAYMRIAHHRVEFYTLRSIEKDEELTADYGPTHHEGRLRCLCGAANCRGGL